MQRKKYSSLVILIVLICTMSFAFSGCWKKGDLSLLYDDESSYTNLSANFVAVACVSSVKQNHVEISFGKLSGIKQLKTLTVDSNTSFDIDVELEEGRLRVILVSGSEWYMLSEGSINQEGYKPEIPAGKYKLRLVADKAAAKIKITIKE